MSIQNKYGLGVWISAIFQMFDKLYIEGGRDNPMGTYLAQKSIQLNTRINIIYGLGEGILTILKILLIIKWGILQ